MPRGGARPNAGRKFGSKTRMVDVGDSKAQAIANVAADGETPLEYMLRVMRDRGADEARRDKMAAAAAPYLHARLESVEQTILGANGQPISPVITLTGQPQPESVKPPPPPEAVESLSNARH